MSVEIQKFSFAWSDTFTPESWHFNLEVRRFIFLESDFTTVVRFKLNFTSDSYRWKLFLTKHNRNMRMSLDMWRYFLLYIVWTHIGKKNDNDFDEKWMNEIRNWIYASCYENWSRCLRYVMLIYRFNKSDKTIIHFRDAFGWMLKWINHNCIL